MLKRILNIFVLIFAIFFIFNNSVSAASDYGPGWNKSLISVYIPQGHAYSEMLLHAFQKWENSSFGKLKFQYVTKQPADIETFFVQKADGTDEAAGSYTLIVQGGKITKADIAIAADSAKYSNQMIYTTMLHEVGHALGLSDSSRKLGIMRSPVVETQDIITNDIVKLYRLNGWSFINKNNANLKP